jgi:hypothetical protein
MTINAKTGSRWRLAERLRADGERPPICRPLPIIHESKYGNAPPESSRRPALVPLRNFRLVTRHLPVLRRSGAEGPLVTEILIANPRLEFRVIRSKQRTGAKSNRERMAILLSDFSSPITRQPFVFGFLTAELPFVVEFLIGTLTNSEFESTCSKHATKQNSNRYKNGISGISVLRSHLAFRLAPVAATRPAGYNSGSHPPEVNQL